MGEYKVIYEIVATTMQQLQGIADEHGLDKQEQIEFFQDMKHSISDDIDCKILKLETKPTIKTKLQLLEDDLDKFDYHFEYSDDHRCWRNGKIEAERIQSFINEMNYADMAQAQELIDEYSRQYGQVFTVPTPEMVENE